MPTSDTEGLSTSAALKGGRRREGRMSHPRSPPAFFSPFQHVGLKKKRLQPFLVSQSEEVMGICSPDEVSCNRHALGLCSHVSQRRWGASVWGPGTPICLATTTLTQPRSGLHLDTLVLDKTVLRVFQKPGMLVLMQHLFFHMPWNMLQCMYVIFLLPLTTLPNLMWLFHSLVSG